ncbi:rhomboid family intramembrane serine protease [Streptomyces sp. R302]|uniref:rhomboid family intramembrane serine protease n=1 Tax=unclassified Streptomyces TaxID=2593676 RepID=UPI00145FC5FC|nr:MULTISPECIES: rhomboid family intramembrane serine protease [unclassified Streptomyces]NML54907.1 rhomboid family intramembrane serine protease [Streptomyces sp. R301]NML83594.1 rhomboid family intramembrane serine protease [Streptomyces sp. R302]
MSWNGTAAGGGTGIPEWSRADRAKAAAKLMAGWVALLWALEGLDLATGHALDAYGIVPRETSELPHLVSAAFLHFGFGHVASNSVPLLVLGFLAALGGIRRFLGVVAVIVVADGLGVWLFSPSGTNTAGASGVVFGLFGYLVVRGFVNRRPLEVLVGLAVAALWGGSMIAGVVPQAGISWQGHFFGLLAGAGAAFLLRRRPGPAALEA